MSLDIQAVVVPLERSTTREAEQAGGVVIVKRRYQPAPVAVEPDVKRMTTAPAGHEHISFAPKHRYTSVAPKLAMLSMYMQGDLLQSQLIRRVCSCC